MSVKNNLNYLLDKKGKSLYWLAQETSISYPTLHKISKNETDSIKFKILESICNTLEISIGEFLEIQKD